MSVRRAFFFDHAWLPSGFARNVRVDIEDGIIRTVEAAGERSGAERIAGIAIPGMPNLHSHAFQRGMAGLSERRGPADDSALQEGRMLRQLIVGTAVSVCL